MEVLGLDSFERIGTPCEYPLPLWCPS